MMTTADEHRKAEELDRLRVAILTGEKPRFGRRYAPIRTFRAGLA